MDIKKVKDELDKLEISRTKNKTFVARFPMFNDSGKKIKIEDMIEYIEFNLPGVEIIKTFEKHITYYKGPNLKDKSHILVEFNI